MTTSSLPPRCLNVVLDVYLDVDGSGGVQRSAIVLSRSCRHLQIGFELCG
jgi:hypothetical protein